MHGVGYKGGQVVCGGHKVGEFSQEQVDAGQEEVQRLEAGFTFTPALLHPAPRLPPRPSLLLRVLRQHDALQVLPNVSGEVHQEVFFALFTLLFFTPLSFF